MPGKLPIDRVRAAEDAPRIYAEEKERFTRNRAEQRALQDPRDDGPVPEPLPGGGGDPSSASSTGAADEAPSGEPEASEVAEAREVPHA